jgi:uncharacterized membrane protein
MDLQTSNELEWQSEQNWLNPKLLGIYASRRDTRLIVPKRSPGFGWTINFGHRYGPAVVFGAVALSLLFAVAGWYFGRCRRETDAA